MTMTNNVAGFKVTGIYPLNRHALSPLILEAKKVSQETGLSFLPMHSLISNPSSKPATEEFTEEEIHVSV